MKTVTPTELRSNIYKLLDDVLASGVPLEINKGGRLLKIVSVEKPDKLDNLIYRPDFIQGDPDDLPQISWEEELTLDLP
ncbi:MAG: antitoxin (DNA-binding transcriptional repressor) of toxin-antitoxin stability system [Cellvibrionaceae bacterium]|jgi:antitoxin (DNA-binding transcriptional repressor) of toxin-antitoxin stability system